MATKKDFRLFLLDGMALIYRAHFALIRAPIFTSSGFNSSAVFGFANIELWRIAVVPLSEPLFLLLMVLALMAATRVEDSARPSPGDWLLAVLALWLVWHTRTVGVCVTVAAVVDSPDTRDELRRLADAKPLRDSIALDIHVAPELAPVVGGAA